MSGNDPLLQPFTLRHLVLKNRIFSTAHEPAYGEAGLPKARYRRYHEEKARGGLALTMTAGSAVVGRDSPEAFGNLHAYKDEIVPWLQELADACHVYGCAVMMQLTHLGRRTAWNKADWLPVVAPSAIREPAHRAFPKVLEDWDLDRIVQDYADAAERVQAGGLDGIEIEAYGHLLDQFWSPATNRRDDDYGGSLDNRLRFTFRVLDAIRDRVGSEFLVGIRMVADEDWEIGLSRAEGLAIAERLVASGRIDFLNLVRGHIDRDSALLDVIPIQGMKTAPHLDFCGEIKAATRFPVFHAARIPDVATARHAIASGKLDMVGMTRAHIADPHLVAKLERGEERRIRPCVGATYCLDRIYEGKDALCIHNAATGRETTMPHAVSGAAVPTRRVVVIGAGPAGLEAARVCAERRHDVVVFEAAAQPGGQLRLATRVPRRRDLVGIVDWRVDELSRLGVEIRCNVYAAAADVLAERPDVVLICTGGLPNTAIVDGHDHVVSSWDVLAGDVPPGERVLVYDDNAQHPGLAAAEFLALAGSKVEIVTPERFFAADIGGLNHAAYARVFEAKGVRLTINKRLLRVAKEGSTLRATIGSDYATATDTRKVDQVVVEHGTLPLDELYFALKPLSGNLGAVDHKALLAGWPQTLRPNPDGRFQLFRLGDAVASRNVHAAIYDALRLGVTL